MIKTIIFDLGGVVLNRGFWIFRENLANEYKIPVERTIEIFIKKYYNLYFSGKISEKEFWENSLRELNIDADWKLLRNKLFKFYKPNKGMLELIDSLRKKGYRTVLLSDQSKEWWPILNKKYSIDFYFDICVISYEIGVSKPNPEVYKIALNKSKSQAKNSLFIDDLEYNLKPANDFGIKTILFKDCNSLKKSLVKFGIKIN
jgi:putative hydrolase of the HAD superfamily